MKNGNLLIGIICVYLCLSVVPTIYAQQADSNPFNITPAAPNNLAFVQPPTTTISGAAFSPVVTVVIRDAYNNSTTATNAVTLSVSTGATLGGTYTNVAAVSGIATFTGVTISGPAAQYTLTASSGSLTVATAQFSISAYGAATTLAWVTNPPATSLAGATMTPAFTVRVTDTYGNNVQGATVSITTTVNTLAVYQGGTQVTTYATANSGSDGIATFSAISMTLVGTGYVFTASASGTNSPNSTGFNITPASSYTLAFTVQPSNTVAGVSISPAVVVTAYDQYSNVVPGVSIAMTISPVGTPTTTLTVTSPQTTDANGTATFNDLSIQLANTGYQLRATGTGGP